MKKQIYSCPSMAAWQMAACTVLLFSMGAWSSALAQVTFTRITEGALVEDMGNFTAPDWGDYDNDGYLDVVVPNQVGGRKNHLYHNNGDGTFSRVMEGVIATDSGAEFFGPAWADQDSDGDLDLFVATRGTSGHRFYRNEGDGTFVKVIEGDWVNTSVSSEYGAWGDYDNDGFVDLYVNTDGPRNLLYHNNGDGTMAPIDSVTNAIIGESHGSNWIDYDGDGDVDLFVGGQSQTQFRNDGNGVFTWITAANGGIPSQVGKTFTDVALVGADYDNDGDLDVLHTAWEKILLYRNDGENGFVDVTSGTLPPGGTINAIGAAWGDYDNDGHQDIFVSNWIGRNLLYHNEGDGTFARITEAAVVDESAGSVSCSWLDYDNDGYLDLFVSNGLDKTTVELCELYRNDGGTNNWIVLNLVGTVSNRSAIGAKVWAQATIDGRDIMQLREISGGGNGGSGEGPRVHIGLGDATTVDTVRIEWPSGGSQVLDDILVDQFLTVTERAWAGHPVIQDQEEYAVTGGFLGALYITYAPWVYCFNSECWFYILEDVAEAGSGWIYATDVASLDMLMVPPTGWGLSGSLSKWIYVADEVAQTGVGWVYML